MRGRVRVLVAVLPVLQVASLIAAGVTLIGEPLDWVFEIARLAAVVAVCAMLVLVSVLLVLTPLRSAHLALALLPTVRPH